MGIFISRTERDEIFLAFIQKIYNFGSIANLHLIFKCIFILSDQQKLQNIKIWTITVINEDWLLKYNCTISLPPSDIKWYQHLLLFTTESHYSQAIKSRYTASDKINQ